MAEERNWLKNDAENAVNLDEAEKGNPWLQFYVLFYFHTLIIH
jgi:hypothetical protein